jgi:hypothetical protein
MDITSMLQELRAERSRLEKAISAIEGIDSNRATHRTQTKLARPSLSAAARKRISMARKQWWAKRKGAKPRVVGKKAAKPTPAKKTTVKRGMSAAGRKRLSEMMKKRWAERKKAKAATA